MVDHSLPPESFSPLRFYDNFSQLSSSLGITFQSISQVFTGTHGTCRRAPGGQEKPGCGQGLGARRPPSTPRGCWRLSHPCPKPSQRRRILATSKYPGSSWVDFPATHNTTRNGCRRDPRPGRPPPAPGEAKAQHGHGTGHRRAHALLAPNETASLHLHLNLRRTGCAFFRKFP